MHVISAPQTAVTMFSRDGEVYVYPSLAAAYKALGSRWIAQYVGKNFREFSHRTRVKSDGNPATVGWVLQGFPYVHETVYVERDYIMRDDFGTPLTIADFAVFQERNRYRGWRYRWLSTWNGEGPVPGVSKCRGGHHYYRRIHHMNARRQCFPVREEGEVPPRAARNQHHLPNNWDDYRVANREDRNWKRYRRTQWRDKRNQD